jgi:polyhydroxyalkanoate synthase subunit PhaC
MCKMETMNAAANERPDDDTAAQRRATAQQLMQAMEAWLNMAGQGASPLTYACADIPNPLIDLMKTHFKAPQEKPQPTPDPASLKPFLDGLDAYQKHPVVREKETPAKIVWQQGTTKLRKFLPSGEGKAAILIIPSLINRYNIFDLTPDHSFLRHLAARELHPFVVDWDEPGDEEKNFGITDYVTKRLTPIMDFLTSKTENVHILGYCMGGLLALALALLKPATVRSLTLMATPWNFKAAGVPMTNASSGDMSGEAQRVKTEAFLKFMKEAEPHLNEMKYFPPEALQAFFANLQPKQVVDKFSRFAGLDPESDEAERFVLSEDWLNEGVPLAAPVARECLREWYGENRPGRILWRVANTLMDPRIMECPAYIIAPGKDKLVPPESAKPLAKLIRGATLQIPQLGHIGLLASHVAPQEVWEPLTRWLLEK